VSKAIAFEHKSRELRAICLTPSRRRAELDFSNLNRLRFMLESHNEAFCQAELRAISRVGPGAIIEPVSAWENPAAAQTKVLIMRQLDWNMAGANSSLRRIITRLSRMCYQSATAVNKFVKMPAG